MLSALKYLTSRLRREETGATAVEYGIMVGLIAVVIIVAVTLLGDNLTQMFGQIACQVGSGGTYTAATGTCAAPTTP
ncbi:Flp family type IVb pilin [Arthrobacter oryzae]|uniref:Flp family type IVb pilin n=1 Tax=Arthrobacter oryzae TaxID=409290 RepID=UPI0030C92619